MATRAPQAAVTTHPPQTPVNSVSGPSSRLCPAPRTATVSYHPRGKTQRPGSPGKTALVRSWISREKIQLGTGIGLLTLIVAIITFWPSFAGSIYGKESLELARWTARKDYVEHCQSYLNLSNIDCQQALEKGLPPPPGLNRFVARSLQRLMDDVQRLEIQPPTQMPDDHVWWLLSGFMIGVIGTTTTALIWPGQATGFISMVRRQMTKSLHLDRALDLELNIQNREDNDVAEPVILRSHSPTQATATGISIEEYRIEIQNLFTSRSALPDGFRYSDPSVISRKDPVSVIKKKRGRYPVVPPNL